jgi:transketolase
VIDNRSATHGWPGGIASRFTVNGWTARTVDGRDHEQIAAALTHQRPDHQEGQTRKEGRPHVVVAEVTTKAT